MFDWVFAALPIAAVVHVLEEYVYPGGFAEALSRLLPRATALFTTKFHVAVNGLLIVLCLFSAFIGSANLVLSLSVFSLVFTNAVLHIRGAIVTKRYYPGVISGVLIYIPLALYAYFGFLSSRQITWLQAGLSFLLGMLYMGSLMVYVLVQQVSNTGQDGRGSKKNATLNTI